jgi:hypothetical protein
MDPSGAFFHAAPRSGSNVSLASLARTAGGRRMMHRVFRGVITFIFAIGR